VKWAPCRSAGSYRSSLAVARHKPPRAFERSRPLGPSPLRRLIRCRRVDYPAFNVRMGKLLLLSFIFATIALPVRASRDPNPERGLKNALKWVIYFNLFYLFNLYYIQARVG
jgi:hypothetical protein